MGGGSWDAGSYTRRTSAKIDAGLPIFTHSASAFASGVYTPHASVDPKTLNKKGLHADTSIRESLDSDEHPESLPIAVIFDVTGSMGVIPEILQKNLSKLYGLVIEKGFVEHPQVLYGAIGDAHRPDHVPLQIGQFESDNRADEALENLILESGGGGTMSESYELAAYFLARKTYTDAWEKRGKKGYLFFIGDERTYPQISKEQVANLIGDSPQDDISTRAIFDELQERWEVFFLYAKEGSYSEAEILDAGEEPAHNSYDNGGIGWKQLLGQRALVLEKAEDVCETIAVTIGYCEGAIDDLDDLDDLPELTAETAGRVSKALATVGGGGSAVAELDGDFDDAGEGAERL